MDDHADLINAAKQLSEVGRRDGNALLGLAVVGRIDTPQRIVALTEMIARAARFPAAQTIADVLPDKGLLSRGAAEAARLVSANRAPYYETLPQIEIIATIPDTWDPLDSLTYVPLDFWLDALKGVEADDVKVGSHRLVRAHSLLRHRPKYPGLVLEPGKHLMLQVAFGGREVREIVLHVPGDMRVKEPVELAVEYRIGSGKPSITVERKRHPTAPLRFEWSSANVLAKSRDKVSPFDEAGALAEAKRRIDLRKARGFLV